ncbi:MAG TPA: hypothetical protein VHC22_33760 [Pirellulales bacterium]|nr:hypothetical protein [Pirellulales bacterium]
MRRPQFTLRALLVVMFGAACFFGGIRFERERRRREEEAAELAAQKAPSVPLMIGPLIIHQPVRQEPSEPDEVEFNYQERRSRAEAVETRGFEGLTPRDR